MEYIKKQSLLADLNETTPHSYFAFETMVRVYPTEDVAPVIHAHWETDNYGYAILNEEGHTLYLAGVPCSRCHVTGQTNWNYCPNCGAKMDEEVG